MAMVVKNNMSAVNTLNTLNKNQSLLGKSLQKVSSGMKINSAQDDASGYAISERMRVMIRSLDQANQNTQNGSSLMKVAEGAVSNTVEILKTLKEKAINAATDTNTEEDRAIIQKEITQLVDQIDDNALITFNGKYLLDGSKSAAGVATYNAWTNQALAEGTSALTKLTDLQARDGEKLTIESTDKVTVSYVQNGKTYVTTAGVGDMTFGGVFNLAEKIDENTTTFATSANESVAKAGGLLTEASNKTIINNALKYLKDALSFDTSTGSAGSTIADIADGAKFVSTESDTNVAGEGGLKLAAVEVGGAGLNSYFSEAIGSATGMSTSYNGELFENVKQALNDYNALVEKMGDATRGAGGNLVKELTRYNPGVNWDGLLGNIQDYKDEIYASGNSTLIEYYETYTTASANKQAAKDVLDSAIMKYNEGLAQLDALTKLEAIETKKEEYLAAVDGFLSSLSSEMQTKTEGTYALEAGASNNTKELSYNSGDESLSDSERSKAIQSILDAVRYKLTTALDDASLDVANLATKLTTAASTLLGAAGTQGGTLSYTSTATPTNTSTALTGEDGTPKATLLTAAGAIDTSAISGIDPGSITRKYIELAQNKILAQYSGPAILTGSNVGVDAAGKIVSTLDGKAGLTFMAANSGTDGQISGFTISISDADGNVRKSVNTSLNAWSTTIYGKNASEKDNSLAFQIGASANQTITVDMADMRAEALGLKGKDGKVVDVSTKENANAAISVFENALQKALDVQTTVGAIEARLEYTASNLTTSTENVQAAESTIRDADMAKEMTNYTKNNVLLQAAQSMLAQANQNSSAVLSLLQ